MTMILVRTAAWLFLLAIFVATVGPIGLRPVSPMPVYMERFVAFLIVGSLFGAAYPKRLLMMMAIVIVTAALFELAQHLVPNRHGIFADFVAKAAGGGLGVLAAATMARMLGFGLTAGDDAQRVFALSEFQNQDTRRDLPILLDIRRMK